jgi:hypothetical protein
MTDTQAEGITKTAEKLEGLIRKYCTSQKDDWRKIPYLALQANTIGRYYKPHFALAYESGLWQVSKEDYPVINIFVDLESGDLVRYNLPFLFDKDHYLKPIEGKDILTLGMDEGFERLIGKLSAPKVIRELSGSIDSSIHEGYLENYGEPFYSIAEYRARQEAWRNAKIEELGLTQLYTRKWPPLIHMK